MEKWMLRESLECEAGRGATLRELEAELDERVKIAAEFLRAAHHADHVYEERIEEGLEEYRRMIVGEEESRH